MITTYSTYLPRQFTNTSPPAGYREYTLEFVGVSPSNTTGYLMKVYTTEWGPYARYLQRKFNESQGHPCGKFDLTTKADNNPGTSNTSQLRTHLKTPNHEFKKRKNEGEIIMSPYEHSVTTVSVVDAKKTLSNTTISSDHALFVNCPLNATNAVTASDGIKGVFKEYKNPGGDYGSGNFFFIENTWCRVFSLGFNFSLVKVSEQDGFSGLDVPVAEISQSLLDEAKNVVISDVFVQNILGKANQGDIDALTTLAELPKSAQSIIDGFSLLLRMAREARKGEFKILASLPDRTQRIKEQLFRKWFKKQIARRPSYRSWKRTRPHGTEKEYHAEMSLRYNMAEWRLRNLDRFNERATVKAQLEIGQAVAGVWLNYRYNILTTKMTIEDALRTFEKWNTIYRRYTDKNGVQQNGSLSALIQHTHKQNCLIKRSYRKETQLKHISRSMNFDVLVTAYELVPLWSIVADWFFTIGPMLRAIQWNPTQDQDKSCAMYKTTAGGSYKLTLNGITYTIKVDQRYFRRDIIEPSRSIGIFFAPDLNISRQLDSLAFAFQSFSGNIKKYHR